MKVSAKSLSLAAGGAETYVGDILRGRVKNPSAAKLGRIAKHLRVPLEALLPAEGFSSPPSAGLELQQRPEDFPLLDPEILVDILTALPHALKRIRHPPTAGRTSDLIYRTHGWILDERAANRPPSADAIINFISHIL